MKLLMRLSLRNKFEFYGDKVQRVETIRLAPDEQVGWPAPRRAAPHRSAEPRFRLFGRAALDDCAAALAVRVPFSRRSSLIFVCRRRTGGAGHRHRQLPDAGSVRQARLLRQLHRVSTTRYFVGTYEYKYPKVVTARRTRLESNCIRRPPVECGRQERSRAPITNLRTTARRSVRPSITVATRPTLLVNCNF